ncbi:MAG: DUF72 domain-containing protein [Acidobacteria bacterium]|nr:DUF72 domain-containing protein [Acidobacteriota bacterium]
MTHRVIRIGTAGWSVHKEHRVEEGSHLEQYARVFDAVEINSTFYRPHREATWRKWAASVPDEFRFAVKAPQTITHDAQLHDTRILLEAFRDQVSVLGEKLGPVLFQLPPKLVFDREGANAFFADVRAYFAGEVVLEPRHASWFTAEVDSLLKQHGVARVAADPPKGSPAAAEPGGDLSFAYYRLHGSPRVYYSSYGPEFLEDLARKIARCDAWVIFDNTTLAHAYLNALSLKKLAVAR